MEAAAAAFMQQKKMKWNEIIARPNFFSSFHNFWKSSKKKLSMISFNGDKFTLSNRSRCDGSGIWMVKVNLKVATAAETTVKKMDTQWH